MKKMNKLQKFQLWLKGRKTFPKKEGRTYKSMTLLRERLFYKGIAAFSVAFVLFLLFMMPVWFTTPQEFQPNSIFDEEAIVMMPRDSIGGKIFGSNLFMVTMDTISDKNISYSDMIIELQVIDKSEDYKEATYEKLREIGMGHYNAKMFSYLAWTYGKGETTVWTAWENILIPIGVKSDEFLTWTFGETWEALKSKTTSLSWMQYFRVMMVIIVMASFSAAIWVEPYRKKVSPKVKMQFPGYGKFIFDPSRPTGYTNFFGVKIPKRASPQAEPTYWWVRNFAYTLKNLSYIFPMLAVALYYFIFNKKYLLDHDLWNTVFVDLFWISVGVTAFSIYQTYKLGKVGLNEVFGKSTRGRRPILKKIAETSRQIEEMTADSDILEREVERGSFENIDRLSRKYNTGSVEATSLAERMSREMETPEDPLGNPVTKKMWTTKSGKAVEDYIKTKYGNVTYYFNSEEDKEDFKRLSKENEKEFQRRMKNKAIFESKYKPFIGAMMKMGMTKQEAEQRAMEKDLVSKYEKANILAKNLVQTGKFSKSDARDYAIRHILDPEATRRSSKYKEEIDAINEAVEDVDSKIRGQTKKKRDILANKEARLRNLVGDPLFMKGSRDLRTKISGGLQKKPFAPIYVAEVPQKDKKYYNYDYQIRMSGNLSQTLSNFLTKFVYDTSGGVSNLSKKKGITLPDQDRMKRELDRGNPEAYEQAFKAVQLYKYGAAKGSGEISALKSIPYIYNLKEDDARKLSAIFNEIKKEGLKFDYDGSHYTVGLDSRPKTVNNKNKKKLTILRRI